MGPRTLQNQTFAERNGSSTSSYSPQLPDMEPKRPVNCIIRNAEATDSIDDMVRAIGKLGTSEEPTLQDSITTLFDASDLTRTFPRIRTLHNIRKDWLSDEELWLAIPEGATARQCLTHVPRHSWKLMVEFFLALNTNVGSWIHNLERRDMMLLGSLTENLLCQKTTSQPSPDPHRMETLDGIQHHEHRKDT